MLPLEDGLTQYISTRGEAPRLGFCDVMLAGLARDGEFPRVGDMDIDLVPSLSPSASTTAAGRRRARLLPHLATRMPSSCRYTRDLMYILARLRSRERGGP